MKLNTLTGTKYIDLPVRIEIGETRVLLSEFYFVKYNSAIPLHVHSFHEGVLFIQGQGIYNCLENYGIHEKKISINFKPGTLLNVPPGLVHEYSTLEEHILVYWKWEVENNTIGLPMHKMQVKENEKAGLVLLADNIFEMITNHQANPALVTPLLKCFLILSVKELYDIPHNINEAINLKDHDSNLTNSILDFIKDNFHQKITLQVLSDYFHKSPRQIIRLLKMQNISLSNELTHQRIKAARQLLHNKSTDTIADIAEKCGFRDVFYFSRVFKRETGHAPGEYRKKNLEVHDG
ncbi:MAG: helix-turn-helix domain-containing protein [Bacteroidota bacterium]